MSIEIGADPAPETYADEKEHRSLIARHSRSVGEAVRRVDTRIDGVDTRIDNLVDIVWAGEVVTAANALFTAHTVSGVVSSDLVFCSPANGNAASMVAGYSGGSTDNGGSVHAVANPDSIAISHPSLSVSVPFNIMVVRP